LDTLDLGTVNQTNNQTILNFNSFAIQVQEIDPSSFEGQTFVVKLGKVEEAKRNGLLNQTGALVTSDTAADVDSNIEESTASIQIQPDLLNECVEDINSSEATQRLSYAVFLTETLFLPENATAFEVGSIVVNARLACQLRNKTMLSRPVKTSFQLRPVVSRI